MAENIIQHKRSSVAGKVPLPSDLEVGEFAVNLVDGIIHSKDEDGNIFAVGQTVTDLSTTTTVNGITIESSTGVDVSIPFATDLVDGFMTASDKVILDELVANPISLARTIFTEVVTAPKTAFDMSAKIQADDLTSENLVVTLNGLEQQNDPLIFTYNPSTKFITFADPIPAEWVVQVTITDIIGD